MVVRTFSILFFGCLLFSKAAKAQELPTPHQLLTTLPSGGEIPPSLLEERSVLLISAQPDAQGMMDPERPKEWARTLQTMFAERGVDAAATFYTLDLLAGREPWEAFEELWQKRQLQNLLWLEELPTGNFRITVAKLPKEAPLLNGQMVSWQMESADVETLSADFRREIIRADIPRHNHLVLDVPEFFADVPMIKKGRYESFPLDLKLDKIAIRWPAGASEELQEEVRLYMDSLYPHEFGFVPANWTDRQVRAEGYQYTFDWVYATGFSLKQLFNYEQKEDETTYSTFMTLGPNENDIKNIPIYLPVYKFYVRHLVTGDLYLGEQWDADAEWKDAMRHFVYNYRASQASRGRR